MRRLIDISSKLTSIFLVGVVLMLCSVAALATHTASSSASNISCNTSCHAHGQSPTGVNSTDQKDEDDKEPVPLQSIWLQIPINLMLLYVAPIFAVLWYVYKRKEIHLTTQLRF